LAQFCVQVILPKKTMVALGLKWNTNAEEFTPCGTPPGLLEALMLPVGPPGVHTVVDEVVEDIEHDIPPPPGLTLAIPPGLSCPPGLDLVDEEDSKCLAAPPGKFAPPGNFTPASPPGMLAAAGPPGFFVVSAGPPGVLSPKSSPPGVWTKDSDALSSSEFSTDADSDSESSADGSFSE
jgi:hypothetical protein